MAQNLETNPEVNKLKPYLILAKEYESFFPICSFYLKQYAANKLMEFYKKIKSEGIDEPSIKQTLNVWLGEIEQIKMKNSISTGSKDQNLKQIEDFTINVFLKADDDERENRFTVDTMRAFQATSKLFEMLNYLGLPSEEFAQKKKYAMAKAIEINRKLKNPELYAPKPKPYEETKMEEEFPREKEGGNTENTINTTHDNNNSMFLLNDSNLERESVDRILKFIDNNKQIFEPFGLSKLVEKSIIQQKQLDNNKNINKVDKIEIENNNDRNTNFIPKSHVNNKEINSSIAKKKVNFSALKDKIQKECQSAITDINSNRIIQAKTDLQNALNLLRTYKE